MAKSVAELCQENKINYEQLVEASGLGHDRVAAILLQRWTPSPKERDKIAAALGTTRDTIAWGHVTPIQHIYGYGPG